MKTTKQEIGEIRQGLLDVIALQKETITLLNRMGDRLDKRVAAVEQRITAMEETIKS